MEKITLRSRNHPNGNRSLYLEFYEKGGKRHYESLNLFLIPEEDENDRRVNEATLKKAVKLKSERVLGVKRPKPKMRSQRCLAVHFAIGWMTTCHVYRQATNIQWHIAIICAAP